LLYLSKDEGKGIRRLHSVGGGDKGDRGAQGEVLAWGGVALLHGP